jgi:hypothetical protein
MIAQFGGDERANISIDFSNYQRSSKMNDERRKVFGCRVLPCVALIGFAAWGCGDDAGEFGADVAGTYMTVAHTVNEDSCEQLGTQVPAEESTPYFELKSTNFFGEKFLGFQECTGPDECEDGVSLGKWMFTEKRGGQYFGQPFASSSPGTANEDGMVPCLVSVAEATATPGGPEVKLEQRLYRGEVLVATREECEPDVAKERIEELTCDQYTVMIGTMDY